MVGGDLAATHRPPLPLNPTLPTHYVDLPPPSIHPPVVRHRPAGDAIAA
jgi:hypothetical protein